MNLNFLLPKQDIFFRYFKDLDACLQAEAKLFYQFSQEFKNFAYYSKQAKEIEHQADGIAYKIVDLLNRVVITPFDREDIYTIVSEIDDVIDLIENVIHNIDLYQIKIKNGSIEEFARLIFSAAEKITKLMEFLKTQKYTPQLRELVIRIHELEDQGDLVFQREIVKLFEHESNPVLVIKWKDIIENLEDILDKCQDVSNVIEGVVIKTS